MALFDIKKVLVGAGIAVVIFVAGADDASAQTRRQIERERQRVERENAQHRRNQQRQRRVNSRNQGVGRVTEQRVNNANYTNGYRYGLMAGEYDRRSGKFNQSNVYRDSGSAPNQGDPTSSDYIYRQGYLQGYNDGYRGGGRNYYR